MAKIVVSAAEITVYIARELEKHPRCAKVWPPQLFWHHRDGNASWDVNIFANSAADAEACDECIRQAVEALRARYQIVEPG